MAGTRRRIAAVVDDDVTVEVDQRREEGLCLPTPIGEQAVPLLEQLGLTARCQPRQAAPADDLEPVRPARIQCVDVDVHPAAELLQQPDVERRQRRQPDHMD